MKIEIILYRYFIAANMLNPYFVIAILILWLIYFFSQAFFHTTQEGNEAVLLQVCQSQYHSMWATATLIWKSVLIFSGMILSWKLRRVTVPALNDSICLTVSLSTLMTEASLFPGYVNLTSTWPNANHIGYCVAIFVGAAVTQTMAFAPKVPNSIVVIYYLQSYNIIFPATER